jgi:hypothetical protein
MSEDRIDEVVKGINYRIEYLKDLKESNEWLTSFITFLIHWLLNYNYLPHLYS